MRKEGGGAVNALSWQPNGARLVYGLEGGEARALTLPGGEALHSEPH